MYLFQTYLKKNISTSRALSKITGIGSKMAIQTCDQLGISAHTSLENLSSSQLTILTQIVQQNLLINNEYRALIREKVKRLTNISCYRGFRHLEGLPCRGQRTHTNACTSKKRRNNATTSHYNTRTRRNKKG